MKAYSIRSVQRIPVSPARAWAFFSNPANLQSITPPGMGFTIISRHQGERMFPGQIIEYRVKPLLGISLYWMTEITHVKEGEFFVDEQRKGPYAFWHHQHHFRPVDGGVEMTDIVHYRIPLGPLGRLAHVLFVRKKLENIFAYRFRQVEEIFGKWTGQTGTEKVHESGIDFRLARG